MERSLELAGLTQSEHGIDTIMHLTCTNMEKGTVDAALRVRLSDLYHDLIAHRAVRRRKSGALRTFLLYAEVSALYSFRLV